MNQALGEFVSELRHLDGEAKDFIPGGQPAEVVDRGQQVLAPDEIMEDWQIPVMKAMAEIATQQHGDVLEIGFGRGVASDFLQAAGVRSHTIVECNDLIVSDFEVWRGRQSQKETDSPVAWQVARCLRNQARFDSVFFHTYPLDPKEHAEYVVQSETFAAHFFAVAEKCLRPGGVFTYLTNEANCLSRGHQRLLFRHFKEVRMSVVESLEIPEDSRDAMWSNQWLLLALSNRGLAMSNLRDRVQRLNSEQKNA